MWGELMVLWPAVSLIGFLVLTALVIALGTRSTARYEREQRAALRTASRATAPEPVAVAQVARAA
jgi:membrane protein implicated in regulation of membrane protease activity